MKVSAEIYERSKPFVGNRNNSTDIKFWYVYHSIDKVDCGLAKKRQKKITVLSLAG